jgi:hypothetical protein
MQSGPVQVRAGAAAGSGPPLHAGEPVQRRCSCVYVRHGGVSIKRIYLHEA